MLSSSDKILPIYFSNFYHWCLSIQQNPEELSRIISNQWRHSIPSENSSQIALSKNSLKSIFTAIHHAKKATYLSQNQLTPQSLFPLEHPLQENHATQWKKFIAACKAIPQSHIQQKNLLIDDIDTLWQQFASNIPTATECLSLYDATKLEAAKTLRAENSEAPYLFIQGDFFGIQDFIFANGSQTNKNAAKILRGRSFQVSLFAELAATKLLQALELPPIAQLLNAAGKFWIIAPNTPENIAKIAAVQESLDSWCLENTLGLVSIGIATLAVGEDIFAEAASFSATTKRLFESLERKKFQRYHLIAAQHAPIIDANYQHGVCAFNQYLPAQITVHDNIPASKISADQIAIGQALTKYSRILITKDSNPIHLQDAIVLKQSIFGYRVCFTKSTQTLGEEMSANLIRDWDYSLAETTQSHVWHGIARRYLNGYVPQFSAQDLTPLALEKYTGVDEKAALGAIKTFSHLACEDRQPDTEHHDIYIGKIALATLKGDIDNLGKLFQSGFTHSTLAKTLALSRQINLFFTLWLPAFCAEHYPNTYTVFAGGDDFFLIGPWHQTQALAGEMQQYFAQYVGNHPDIHFSVGISQTKPNIPIHHLAHTAEEMLDAAKGYAIEENKQRKIVKNAITVYGQTVSWQTYRELAQVEEDIKRLLEQENTTANISTGYIYSLLGLIDLRSQETLESQMWRSRFAYRSFRHAQACHAKDEDLQRQLNQTLCKLFGENGIEKYGSNFKIPLFNHFYALREK